MLADCRITVASSGVFVTVFCVCDSKDVPMNTEVYSCRCHHNKACLAALPELKMVLRNRPRMGSFCQRRKRVRLGNSYGGNLET